MMRSFAMALAVGVLAGRTMAVDVKLTMTDRAGQPRVNEPVRVGVPLPKGTAKGVQAMALLDADGKPIACQFTPVCRWLREYRHNGAAGLAAKPVPGRPSKLNARRRRALTGCLLKGAEAFGFATGLWTCPRIAQLIEQRYGVHYHVDAIPRLMASLGFSPSETRTPGG